MTKRSERLDEREEQWVYLALGKSRCGCCDTKHLSVSRGSRQVSPPPGMAESWLRR